jgi:hypothetical protein
VVQERLAVSNRKDIEPTLCSSGYQNWEVDLEIAVVGEKKRKKVY